MKRPSLVLADDHVLVMEGLTHVLQQDFNIAGIAQNGRELITMAKQFRPDVIVSDISMPQLNGIDAARILQRRSHSRFLFLSMHSELSLVEEALRAGALGYVLKMCSMEELTKAIPVCRTMDLRILRRAGLRRFDLHPGYSITGPR